MDKDEEVLRQQLELLAAESKKCDPQQLPVLTHAMCEIFNCLLDSACS